MIQKPKLPACASRQYGHGVCFTTITAQNNAEMAAPNRAIHRNDGATIRASVGGVALEPEGGGEAVELRAAHAARNLNVHFKPVRLEAGEARLVLECVEPGFVGLDFLWVK